MLKGIKRDKIKEERDKFIPTPRAVECSRGSNCNCPDCEAAHAFENMLRGGEGGGGGGEFVRDYKKKPQNMEKEKSRPSSRGTKNTTSKENPPWNADADIRYNEDDKNEVHVYEKVKKSSKNATTTTITTKEKPSWNSDVEIKRSDEGGGDRFESDKGKNYKSSISSSSSRGNNKKVDYRPPWNGDYAVPRNDEISDKIEYTNIKITSSKTTTNKFEDDDFNNKYEKESKNRNKKEKDYPTNMNEDADRFKTTNSSYGSTTTRNTSKFKENLDEKNTSVTLSNTFEYAHRSPKQKDNINNMGRDYRDKEIINRTEIENNNYRKQISSHEVYG